MQVHFTYFEINIHNNNIWALALNVLSINFVLGASKDIGGTESEWLLLTRTISKIKVYGIWLYRSLKITAILQQLISQYKKISE